MPWYGLGLLSAACSYVSLLCACAEVGGKFNNKMATTEPGGSSLVSTILKRSSTLDDTHLEDYIQKVKTKCSDLKGEILGLVKQNYQEFMIQADSTVVLEQRVQEVLTDFNRLSVRIESDLKTRLSKSAGKRKEIEAQYKETEEKLAFVDKLLSIHLKLEQLRKMISNKQYVTCTSLMSELSELLSKVEQAGCEAKVFKALKSELALLKSDLKTQLLEEWNVYVQWRPAVPTQELDHASALKASHIVTESSNPAFSDIVQSLRHVLTKREWEERVNRYSTRLLDAFVKPLIKSDKLRLEVSHNDYKNVISLELADDSSFSMYTHLIIEGLVMLLEVIDQIVDHDSDWMPLLGQKIEPELSSLLIKHVLSKQLSPEHKGHFQMTKDVTLLEAKLKETRFVEESYSVFSDYTLNVDTHLATKQCQEVLVQARSILMRPIHDTVQAGNEDTRASLQKLGFAPEAKNGTKEPPDDNSELDISSLTFAFPTCLVSQSVKEFVDLLYQTLLSCASSTPPTAMRLYYTGRDMVELFIAIYQSYHAPSVSELPRSAAVQHNNYMFVAHHLITVAHQFHSHIPVPGATFIDYVPQLRGLGEECFLDEMDKQSKTILEFVPQGSLEDLSVDATKYEAISRGIRQSLLHIYKLAKVYGEVLTDVLYYRSRGGLLNVLVTELTDRVLAMTDIAATDASAMYDLLHKEVVDKGPTVLVLPRDGHAHLAEYCTNWERLKEVMFVLDASQEDIVGRWDKGRGPLAKQMSVVEVKQMIRALFKNTERRADTLNKISN